MTTVLSSEILEDIQNGETQFCEFKRSAEKNLADEAAAFANASGGRIYIGVDDDGTICGTDTSNRERARIKNIISKIEPRIHIKLEVADSILKITIPEGNNKLYMTPNGFFMRLGTLTQKMTRQEIFAYLQRENRLEFDSAPNRQAQYPKTFSVSAFEEYLSLSSLKEAASREQTLRNLKAVTDDVSGGKVLTNTGVLFFAKSPDMYLPHASIVCAVYKGKDKAVVLNRKIFSGNLISNIEDSIQYVVRYTNTRFEITGLRRKEIPDIPEVALREVIVNAVCHRNYYEHGAMVSVDIFDDRICITNPGGLPDGLNPKMFGKLSVARNPAISSLLYRAGYIEKPGSGISRIRQSLEDAGLPDAEYEFDSSFLVTIYRDSYLCSPVSNAAISSLGRKILTIVEENPEISGSKIASSLKISERTVFREIKKLRDEEVLFRIGSCKKGFWRVRKLI